jgi:WD40 repeat protein
MRFQTCLIVWHGKEPVLSVDFHPSGRLATGGADNTVKVL